MRRVHDRVHQLQDVERFHLFAAVKEFELVRKDADAQSRGFRAANRGQRLRPHMRIGVGTAGANDERRHIPALAFQAPTSAARIAQ